MRTNYTLDGRKLDDDFRHRRVEGDWICSQLRERKKDRPCTTSPNTLAERKKWANFMGMDPIDSRTGRKAKPRVRSTPHNISRRQKRAAKARWRKAAGITS